MVNRMWLVFIVAVVVFFSWGCKVNIQSDRPPLDFPALEETSSSAQGVTQVVPADPGTEEPTETVEPTPPPSILDLIPPIYAVQSGTPATTANFYYPDSLCSWTGVGGQVFGLDEQPILGLVVKVSGTVEGTALQSSAITGSAVEFGPGGYRVKIADKLVATQGTLTVQLFDVDGNERSAKIALNTLADCKQNLILVNFNEVVLVETIHFPIIISNKIQEP